MRVLMPRGARRATMAVLLRPSFARSVVLWLCGVIILLLPVFLVGRGSLGWPNSKLADGTSLHSSITYSYEMENGAETSPTGLRQHQRVRTENAYATDADDVGAGAAGKLLRKQLHRQHQHASGATVAGPGLAVESGSLASSSSAASLPSALRASGDAASHPSRQPPQDQQQQQRQQQQAESSSVAAVWPPVLASYSSSTSIAHSAAAARVDDGATATAAGDGRGSKLDYFGQGSEPYSPHMRPSTIGGQHVWVSNGVRFGVDVRSQGASVGRGAGGGGSDRDGAGSVDVSSNEKGSDLPAMRGIVLLFHGCSHTAEIWATGAEEQPLLSQLTHERLFAVSISAESTKQPNNHNCWDGFSEGYDGNADVRNAVAVVAEIARKWDEMAAAELQQAQVPAWEMEQTATSTTAAAAGSVQGRSSSTTPSSSLPLQLPLPPIYAIGASSGGLFVQLLPLHIRMSSILVYIMGPHPLLFSDPEAGYLLARGKGRLDVNALMRGPWGSSSADTSGSAGSSVSSSSDTGGRGAVSGTRDAQPPTATGPLPLSQIALPISLRPATAAGRSPELPSSLRPSTYPRTAYVHMPRDARTARAVQFGLEFWRGQIDAEVDFNEDDGATGDEGGDGTIGGPRAGAGGAAVPASKSTPATTSHPASASASALTAAQFTQFKLYPRPIHAHTFSDAMPHLVSAAGSERLFEMMMMVPAPVAQLPQAASTSSSASGAGTSASGSGVHAPSSSASKADEVADKRTAPLLLTRDRSIGLRPLHEGDPPLLVLAHWYAAADDFAGNSVAPAAGLEPDVHADRATGYSSSGAGSRAGSAGTARTESHGQLVRQQHAQQQWLAVDGRSPLWAEAVDEWLGSLTRPDLVGESVSAVQVSLAAQSMPTHQQAAQDAASDLDHAHDIGAGASLTSGQGSARESAAAPVTDASEVNARRAPLELSPDLRRILRRNILEVLNERWAAHEMSGQHMHMPQLMQLNAGDGDANVEGRSGNGSGGKGSSSLVRWMLHAQA